MAHYCGQRNYCPAIRNLNNPIERQFDRCWPTANNDKNAVCRELERCMKLQEAACSSVQSQRPHSAPPTFQKWRTKDKQNRLQADACCSTDPYVVPYPTDCGYPAATCATNGRAVPQQCLDLTVYGRSVSPPNYRKLWLAQCQQQNTSPVSPPSSSCSSTEGSDEECDDEDAETQTPLGDQLKPSGSEHLYRTPEKTKLRTVPEGNGGQPERGVSKTQNQFESGAVTETLVSTTQIPLTSPESATFAVSESIANDLTANTVRPPAPDKSVTILIEHGNPEVLSGPLNIDVQINHEIEGGPGEPSTQVHEISVDHPPEAVVEIFHGETGTSQIKAFIQPSVASLVEVAPPPQLQQPLTQSPTPPIPSSESYVRQPEPEPVILNQPPPPPIPSSESYVRQPEPEPAILNQPPPPPIPSSESYVRQPEPEPAILNQPPPPPIPSSESYVRQPEPEPAILNQPEPVTVPPIPTIESNIPDKIESIASNIGDNIPVEDNVPDMVTPMPEAPIKAPEMVTPMPEAPIKAPEMVTPMPEAPIKAPEMVTPMPEAPIKAPEMVTPMPEAPIKAPQMVTPMPANPVKAPIMETPVTVTPVAETSVSTNASENSCTETDTKIIEKLRKHHRCPLCKEILFHTVRMVGCKHHFCRYCILKSTQEKKNCPVCGKDFRGFTLKPGVDTCIDNQFALVCEKYQKERQALIALRYFPERKLCQEHSAACREEQRQACLESNSGQMPKGEEINPMDMKCDVDWFCRMMKKGRVDPQFQSSMVCRKLCDGTLDPDKNRIHQFLSMFPDTESKCQRFCKHLKEQQRRSKTQGRSKSDSGRFGGNNGGMPIFTANDFKFNRAFEHCVSNPFPDWNYNQPQITNAQTIPNVNYEMNNQYAPQVKPSKLRPKTGLKVTKSENDGGMYSTTPGDPEASGLQSTEAGMKTKAKKPRPKTTRGQTENNGTVPQAQQPSFPPMATQVTYDQYNQMIPASNYYDHEKRHRKDRSDSEQMSRFPTQAEQQLPRIEAENQQYFQGGSSGNAQRYPPSAPCLCPPICMPSASPTGLNFEQYRYPPLQQPLYQPMSYSPFHHHPMRQMYDPHKHAFKWGGPNALPATNQLDSCRKPVKRLKKRVSRDIAKQIQEIQMIEQAKLLEKAVKECDAARRQRNCPVKPILRITCPINYSMPKVRMEDGCPP